MNSLPSDVTRTSAAVSPGRTSKLRERVATMTSATKSACASGTGVWLGGHQLWRLAIHVAGTGRWPGKLLVTCCRDAPVAVNPPAAAAALLPWSSQPAPASCGWAHRSVKVRAEVRGPSNWPFPAMAITSTATWPPQPMTCTVEDSEACCVVSFDLGLAGKGAYMVFQCLCE